VLVLASMGFRWMQCETPGQRFMSETIMKNVGRRRSYFYYF
jgi:hypothetical protein